MKYFTLFFMSFFLASTQVLASDWNIDGITPEQKSIFATEGFDPEDIISSLDYFSLKEIENAIIVKRLHDKVEHAAYAALAEKVKALKIKKDQISTEQSHEILYAVKAAAHKVMRADDGYMPQRGKFLNLNQLGPVIAKVSWITHDRDRKLTNGSYTSLTQLLFALDDHNINVNKILFSAWGYPMKYFEKHLDMIKEQVNFYVIINGELSFDLAESLHMLRIQHNNIARHFREVTYADSKLSFTLDGKHIEIARTQLDDLISGTVVHNMLDNICLATNEQTIKQFYSCYFPELIFN